MKIQRFEAVDLLGRSGTIDVSLNDDINIVTGRNGAGKTTLLKLMWYIVSGNILIALREIPFSKCRLITDIYDCTIHRSGSVTCKIDLVIGDKEYSFDDVYDDDGDIVMNAEDQANSHLRETGSSIFFPTFRRIEGGFTLTPAHRLSSNLFSQNRLMRKGTDIEEALQALSKELTNDSHTFVSSISTVDIVSILMRKYTDLSEDFNRFQSSVSQDVIERIRSYEADKSAASPQSATEVLSEIKTTIEGLDVERISIMAPLTAVQRLVERLFQHTGIRIGSRLNFGDAANAVNSDSLSAGEKQMLSFVCYNAFYKNSVIFIDEPELSLHVDWQRQLLPIMSSQGSGNQFVIATHSPFIYSKYPDKELLLSPTRGDEGE